VIQLTPHMRILVAVEAVDFRKGIDGLARLASERLRADPFSGYLFVYRNRRATTVKLLVYDGQGFWLCQKRLSSGRFRWWPGNAGAVGHSLDSHELAVLLQGGDPRAAKWAPQWRRLTASA
jgi:transposase